MQHHPAEPHVVVRGRYQSAAAGFQFGRRGVDAFAGVVLQRDPAALLRLIAGGETIELFRWAPERGIGHAQRLEQPCAQEFAETHAAELLHQIAHHVDRDGVVPRRSRRELQRQRRQLLDHRLEAALGVARVDASAAIGGIDIGAVHEPIGQARGVGHQIHHLHRPRRPASSCKRRRRPGRGWACRWRKPPGSSRTEYAWRRRRPGRSGLPRPASSAPPR